MRINIRIPFWLKKKKKRKFKRKIAEESDFRWNMNQSSSRDLGAKNKGPSLFGSGGMQKMLSLYDFLFLSFKFKF